MNRRLLVALSVFMALAQAAWVDEDDIDLTLSSQTNISCKKPDGREGICVHESMCEDEFVIPPADVGDYDEIHISRCPGLWDWCCLSSKLASTETTTDINLPTTGKN
ncbi:uncharacterized protein LOC133530133 [Cydia pomonella]|uniref:uncharacterized protein LOC133530133 n=1 Tax=Cydia pomonella TaxID=82600 RepID=UPI002ADE735A|nr:uncharacterized protein LOC133530133 [Cydia pomonella]